MDKNKQILKELVNDGAVIYISLPVKFDSVLGSIWFTDKLIAVTAPFPDGSGSAHIFGLMQIDERDGRNFDLILSVGQYRDGGIVNGKGVTAFVGPIEGFDYVNMNNFKSWKAHLLSKPDTMKYIGEFVNSEYGVEFE